jgi:tetratricopeptide (TPR) repeat protein
MTLVRSLFFYSLLAFAALTARAQSVRWEPADSGDPSELQLVFESCEPNGDPRLPVVLGVNFVLTGTTTQTSIINFSTTRSTILTYRFRSQRNGPVQIPAFTVDTDKGELRVPAYTGGTAAAPLDSVANSTLAAPATTVWAGEVFPLTYTIGIVRRYYAQIGQNVDWVATPLVAEDWSKPEPFQTTNGNDQRVGFIYRTRVYAKTPGRITLNPAQQVVNLQTGSIGFGLFQQPRLEQVSVTSNKPDFVVRPLPAGAPASFNGAVGQFTLESKVVPATAAVGEPVTWTLNLAGNGNWPDIPGLPSRDVSKDFQVVQPQAKRTPTEGKLFDATLAEDVVLVPSRPGTYTLGPVSFSYFDPRTSTYQTITTPKTTVTITAPAPKPNVTPSETASTPEAAATAGAAVSTAKPPAPPGVIPRDPLPGSGNALVPLSKANLAIALSTPFGVLLVTWIIFALQRARQTDPLRSQREARQRLLTTLAQLRSAPDAAARTRLILAWQHDATTLWKLSHAAPPAAMFSDPAWAALWAESDRALYGAEAPLPEDWATRAETALTAKRLEKFSSAQLFLSRNLLPFFVVALALAVSGALLADPVVDYRSGKFAEAGAAWESVIKTHPQDWVARHNLALVLAQQDRWGEAEAQMTAAYLQNPRDPSVRWHLVTLSEKAGYVPDALAAFLQPGPLQWIARLASPAEWQWLLVIAAILVAAGLGCWLTGSYRRLAAWWKIVASVSFALGLLLAVVGIVSLSAYTNAADSRAVITAKPATLWSIPTEADTAQKTTALSAGSIAIVDRVFLGWNHLTFANGQTGWVKKEDIVGLWK